MDTCMQVVWDATFQCACLVFWTINLNADSWHLLILDSWHLLTLRTSTKVLACWCQTKI